MNISKASVFVRQVGSADSNAVYVIPSTDGVAIEAGNFYKLEQGNPSLIFDVLEAGYFGGGYIKIREKEGSGVPDWPTISYPMQCDVPGLYKVYLRINISNLDTTLLDFDIEINGEVAGSFNGYTPISEWTWVSVPIVIPDIEVFDFSITPRTENLLIDTIYISSGDLPSEISFSPIYVTLHLKAYELNSQFLPEVELPIYDFKTSRDEIRSDDWYNFSIETLEGSSPYLFDVSTSIALMVSGVSDSHYLIWDYSEDTIISIDPYNPACSLIFNTTTRTWESFCDRQFAIRIYDYNGSLNEDATAMITPAATLSLKVVKTFDDEDSLPVYLNTHVVDIDSTSQKVELSLPDRIVNFLIDQSGSQTWNDNEGLRHDMCRRMLNRINSTYTGDLKYNIFTVGATPIKLNFFAVVESEDIDTSRSSDVASAFFADQESGFAGVRLIRKTDSFPSTPVDGDIVTEGFVEQAFDDNLLEGVEYFYKAFTYDANNRFSSGVEIKATPRIRNIPRGIGQFSYNILLGSGVRRDENTVGLWHFGEETGDKSFNFTESKVHLSYSGLNQPIWLNISDVPIGFSGVRLSGQDESFDGSDPDAYLWFDTMTIMGWVYPFSDSGTEGFFSYGGLSTNGIYVGKENSSLFFTSDFVDYVYADGLVANQWNHVAVVIDNSVNPVSVKLYINGSLINTGTVTGPISRTGYSVSIGNLNYNPTGGHFFGKITEFSVHKVLRDSSYIYSYSQPNGLDDQDNGDRIVILNYSIPQDFTFSGGRVRVLEKENIGTSYIEIIGYDDKGEPIKETKYGLPPYHENDGNIVYDDEASSGAFTFSIVKDFVHGRKYFYKIFSQSVTGAWCFESDAPVLEIEIPVMERKDDYIGEPSPSLPEISNLEAVVGNRKIYLTWNNQFSDDRIHQIKVWYSSESYPIIQHGFSDGKLVFIGNGEEDGFVHRNIDNDKPAYYSIIAADQYGYHTEPLYITEIPKKDANEVSIPLLNIRKLRYEVVDDESISLAWENPIKFEKKIDGWFDDRVIFYAQITDEFGALIQDTSNIQIVAQRVNLGSAELAEDVFGDVVDRSVLVPSAEDVYILSYTSLGNGLVKGILRMSADITILSSLSEVSFDIIVYFNVPDRETPETNVFEFYSKPISVSLKNPWQIELINYGEDRIKHLCKSEVPLFDNEFLTTLSFEPDKFKEFDGTYIRRSSPFVARVKATYRGEKLLSGNKCFVSVNEASDPQCDPEGESSVKWQPSFSDKKSQSVLPPSTSLEFYNIIIETDGVQQEFSVVDIPLQPPRSPQGVMLFIKTTYNGFVSRKKMYIAFENILRVDLTINEPEPDCIDRAEQFAACYLINPDNPDSKTSLPDSQIVRWQLQKGLTGKDRPFYSTDSVPSGPGIFSYVRSGSARQVFFGPACGVVPQIMTHKDLGLVILPEIYAVKASIVYDGLQAFEELPLFVWPKSLSSVFGSRFLMELPKVINDVWADGYDYKKLIISHNPNSSDTQFSSCFRECASQYDSDMFEMASGQIINLYSGEIEMIYGNDVEIEFDETIGEYIISGGTNQLAQAEVPLLQDSDETPVYLKINKFIGPQEPDTSSKSGEPQTGVNPCSCVEIGPNDKEKKTDIIISGDTLILISGKERTLRGGGDLKTGVPPTIVRLKEPLSIRFVDQRVNDIPVEKLSIDGVTVHEFIVEVSFSGKPVPDGTPVTLEIGGTNPERIILTPSLVAYTSKQNDPFLNPDGLQRSFARFAIAPLNPATSFSAQIRATTTYDKRGDIERKMQSCITITYDVNQVTEDQVEDQSRTIDNVFSNRLDRYDISGDEWTQLADMNHPRGAMSLEWVADEYGEKLWAIGGVDGNKISAYNEEYDITNNKWVDAESMPTPRFYHMSAMHEGYIYIFGGITLVDDQLSVTRSVERYDPISDTWETLSSMPQIGSFDQEPYGVAIGTVAKVGNRFYIMGGIRRISLQATVESLNDRILVYNIDTNEWSYSDVFQGDDLDLYQRIGPVSFVNNDNIRVLGGAVEVQSDSGTTLQFLTNTFYVDISDLSIYKDEEKYDVLPLPRYKAMSTTLENKSYIIGGSDKNSQSLNILNIIDTNVSPTLPFICSFGENITKGRSSAGLTNDNFGYIYLAGGIESGRPPGFVQIEATARPYNIRLDGRQSVGIDISLKDEMGVVPDSVGVFVKGFVVLPNAGLQQGPSGGDQGQQDSGGSVSRNDLIYPVVFSRNEFLIENGFGSTVMLPRSDDILKNVKDINERLGVEGKLGGQSYQDEALVIREGETRNPYIIRVQISIVDDFYYGETVVDIIDNIDEPVEDPYSGDSSGETDEGSQGTSPTVKEDFLGCSQIETTKVIVGPEVEPPDPGSGLDIEGLPDNNSVFDLTPSQMPQLKSPEIQYYSDIDWIPQVNKVLYTNDSTYTEALKALNKISAKIPFGASPVYDGLVEISQTLLDDSADGYSKVIYVHTDNEENLSRNSVDDAIDEIQSIDGFAQVPVVLNNYSVVFPITLSALISRTDTDSLEKIANQTGGQSQTVLSATFIDEILNNSIGRMIGSIGYGVFEYTIDLSVDCIISKIALDYILYENTDGNWKIAVSSDGFNYSEFSEQFPANTEVDFTDLFGRYIRVQATILSGLSSSIEEVYEGIPTPGTPAITAINITYNIPTTSYLFLKSESLPYSAQQIAVSVNANRPLLSSVDIGASVGFTFNWDDYQSGSQPSVDQYGKIFVPIRTKQDEIILNEPLENIDGFAFKAKYGRWSDSSRVVVRDSDGQSIDSSEYKIFSRTGLIVFSKRRNGNLVIDIENSDQLRVGVKITNKYAGKSVEVSGVGYMYNTNVFLSPPLSERAPTVTNVECLPLNPTIFSKISVTYKYNDLNRDLEDEEGTSIRWFINGVEREYLRNLRYWNDISDDNDPLWTYGLYFERSDIPSGMTAEEYARQQKQSLLFVGDQIYVTVKPFDGKGYGEEIRSASVIVVESPPFVTSLIIKGRSTGGVVQNEITTGTIAFADFNYFADNPDNRSTIVWYVNGVEFKRGDLGATVGGYNNDEILPQESYNNVTALEIGNLLEVEIIPSTALKIGDAVRSESKTVENQPPAASDVHIIPENPTSTSNLNVSYVFVDADLQSGDQSQSNQSSIRWFKANAGSADFVEELSLRDKSTVQASSTSPNEKWQARIIPFDGISVGETAESNIVTISS